MPRLELLRDGRKRVFELLDDRLTVGTRPENELRIPGDVEFVLTRAPVGFRLVAPADRSIRVNDQDCTERELRDGDRIELGEIVLVYRDELAPQPPSVHALLEQAASSLAPAAAGAGPVAMAAKRRGRPARRPPGGMPGWLWISSLLCVAALLLWLLVQAMSGAGFSRSPKDLLALAESQLAQGSLQRALGTIDQALANERIDAGARQQAQALRARVAAAIERQADAAALASADRARDLLLQFAQREAARAPPRALARAVVRRADQWLADHRAVTSRHAETRAWAGEVVALRARYEPAAQLGQPEDADDVLFRADLTARQSNRPYRAVLADLDAFLAREGNEAERERVQQARARYLRDSQLYVAARLRELGRAAERGRIADVREELDRIERESAPDDMAAEIAALRQRLQR